MSKEEKKEKLYQKLMEMKTYENKGYENGANLIAGIDEVGRGPLAGPVVAACVVLPRNFEYLGIDDSKKITEKKREILYKIIVENALSYGIGWVFNDEIDEINILEATKKAMEDAYNKANIMCIEKGIGKIDYLLIDAVDLKNIDVKKEAIVKGDTKSISIAAASIIAKVTRDKYMVEMSKKYEGYALERNKGYGTKLHYEGIENHGISEIHRKSFLKKFLNNNKQIK